MGVVRARDIDKDGIPIAQMFEYLRTLGAARDPRLWPAGYLIFNERITKSDFSGWKVYTGSNPHDKHGHISFSTNRAGYDSTAPWGLARFAGGVVQPLPTPGDDLQADERKALLETHAMLRLLTSQLVYGSGKPDDPTTWGWLPDEIRSKPNGRITVVDGIVQANRSLQGNPANSARLVVEAIAPMLMDAVQKVMGGQYTAQANEIVTEIARRLQEA